MDLSRDWPYIEKVAAERLRNNITPHHVDKFGPSIEVMGAAGELAARRYLQLPENLHTGFDGGCDLELYGLSVNVKATKLTQRVAYRFLQWPIWKIISADIVFMTAVDFRSRKAAIIGYTFGEEIKRAPVNFQRYQPCHEIALPDLRPAWELLVKDEIYRQYRNLRTS